ncbi:hypothetical protein, partial [Micromonospora sp. WMMD736]|uniref:hypothetical protein n=1 Tax=Micromonospora sp. WMMD736 TaxID=3404112 RepID=UPI003B93F5ED
AIRTRYHEFWPCEVSVLDPAIVDRSRVHSPKHVTDAYLLALAVANGGTFVTFDQSIPISTVRAATAQHLTVL